MQDFDPMLEIYVGFSPDIGQYMQHFDLMVATIFSIFTRCWPTYAEFWRDIGHYMQDFDLMLEKYVGFWPDIGQYM